MVWSGNFFKRKIVKKNKGNNVEDSQRRRGAGIRNSSVFNEASN